ncbi:hypothetical protein MRX96_030157 [Rhipicephalus microplus]
MRACLAVLRYLWEFNNDAVNVNWFLWASVQSFVIVENLRRMNARKPICRSLSRIKELRQVNFKGIPLNVGQRDRGHQPCFFTTSAQSYGHWEAYVWTNAPAPHSRELLERPQAYLLPKWTS